MQPVVGDLLERLQQEEPLLFRSKEQTRYERIDVGAACAGRGAALSQGGTAWVPVATSPCMLPAWMVHPQRRLGIWAAGSCPPPRGTAPS